MNQGVLAGILKWSLSQGDGLQPSDDVKPLSEEDADFLLDAFESVTIDEVQRMQLIAQIIALPEDPTRLTELTRQSTAFIADLTRVSKGVTEGHSVAVTPDMAKTKKKRRPWQNRPANNNSGEGEGKRQMRREEEQEEGEEAAPVDRSSLDVDALLSEVLSRKEGALDELDDRVLSLDNAVDLHTVGGFPPLLACLSSSHASIRWRAAQALATICQNNPRCQQFAHDLHAVTPLLQLIATPPTSSSLSSSSTDNAEWLCVIKALYALSSLLRSATPATSDFLRHSGVESVVLLLQLQPPPPVRVVAKGMGLLRAVVENEREGGGEGEGVCEVMTKMGVWEVVQSWVGADDVNVREEAVRLMAVCSEDRGVRLALQREHGLVERLSERKAEIGRLTGEERDAAEEEHRLIDTVLQQLANPTT